LKLIILIYGWLTPAWAAAVDPAAPVLTDDLIRRVKEGLPPLVLSESPISSPAAVNFHRYYDIHYEHVPHYFGTFQTDGWTIAAHVYLPRNASGTVFLLHGYFDHTGILKNLIRRCLDLGYSVACFDLPGHGLSSGEKGRVTDFAEYATAFEAFLHICRPYLPQPYHLVSHSAGSAVALEFISQNHSQDPKFDKIILVAPLIHHSYHRITRAQYFLVKPFVESFPRRFHQNSSDSVFVQWVKQDPLQGNRIPVSWLEALYEWNQRFEKYDRGNTPLLVVQGDRDSVVDWRYNIALLKKKYSAVTVKWIENGRHQLLNESGPIRKEVLRSISSYLSSSALSTGS
jgi:alpha-beta hydrolase superfamily lysophospholipase